MNFALFCHGQLGQPNRGAPRGESSEAVLSRPSEPAELLFGSQCLGCFFVLWELTGFLAESCV